MPLKIAGALPTIFVRKDAFEEKGLKRVEIDEHFNLTDLEFNVEEGLIVLGPLPSADLTSGLIGFLERRGLEYFDDFFELSGNWPEWLTLYARGRS
jgi:hypothetical protein